MGGMFPDKMRADMNVGSAPEGRAAWGGDVVQNQSVSSLLVETATNLDRSMARAGQIAARLNIKSDMGPNAAAEPSSLLDLAVVNSHRTYQLADLLERITDAL